MSDTVASGWKAQPGEVFSRRQVLSQADFNEFADLSGDDNPIHVDPKFAAETHFGTTVSHGMLLYSLVCGTISEHFPGARQVEQELMFPNGTPAGDTVEVRLTVLEADTEAGRARLQTETLRGDGEQGLRGETVIEYQGEAA